MSFRLLPPPSPQLPDAQASAHQGEPSQRPASTTPEPTGLPRPRSSAGPTSPLRRSPPEAPAAPATHGNPQREGSAHEFPAQRLEEVLRECRALPNILFSAPPSSIASLSANELSLLADTLRRRFLRDPHNPGPADLLQNARQAVRAWGMVQSARLRRPGSNAHDTSLRREHAEAVNDFLQVLHPATGLPQNLHTHLLVAFNHQIREGRIPPQVNAVVTAQGIETLAEQGYRLDSRTGAFAPAGELLLSHVLSLSSTPRSRIGKLPDSEQYRHIRSMTPDERILLEGSLASRFMNQAGPAPSESALQALDAWLTTQQVRLRVHSEASIQRHAQALRHPVIGLRMAAAGLGAARWPRELSRFHSEHESSNRPEYAIALNNFLRMLRPSNRLLPDLQQRIAERLTHHAEVEGTLSAPVVEAIRQHGPYALAAADWRLDAINGIFSAPLVVIAPEESVYWWAQPAPHTPASPIGTGQPSPGISRSTPASAPAPR